jgi:hypothetical protein
LVARACNRAAVGLCVGPRMALLGQVCRNLPALLKIAGSVKRYRGDADASGFGCVIVDEGHRLKNVNVRRLGGGRGEVRCQHALSPCPVCATPLLGCPQAQAACLILLLPGGLCVGLVCVCARARARAWDGIGGAMQAKLYAALSRVDARFKVLLTGTPIQNHLAELFALLHFLEPAKFASEDDFPMSNADLATETAVCVRLCGGFFLARLVCFGFLLRVRVRCL